MSYYCAILLTLIICFTFDDISNELKQLKISKAAGPDKISSKLPRNMPDCGNYRPISVISVIAEIYEKLVYEQLSSLRNNIKLLSAINQVFAKKHSTETAFIYSSKPMAI